MSNKVVRLNPNTEPESLFRKEFTRQVESDRKEGYLPDDRAVDRMAKDFAADFPDPK